MQCPDCQRGLKAGVNSCPCGWSKTPSSHARGEPAKEHIQCAHQECGNHAIVRERTPSGWANLCYEHMMAAANKRAKEYCESLGLKTAQDCRDWLRENKLLVKRAPVLEREPGCDDE